MESNPLLEQGSRSEFDDNPPSTPSGYGGIVASPISIATTIGSSRPSPPPVELGGGPPYSNHAGRMLALSFRDNQFHIDLGGNSKGGDGKRKGTTTTARSTTPISSTGPSKGGLGYYLVYALVNVIIGVPGLYGYSSVIFNHPVFQPHMNALSKLVIFSSLIHQLGFTLFSTLPFAIGMVQDAGLIFLSSMSNRIATIILEDENGTEQAVLSTTIVLLSGGTAALGLVLILMGRFRLADAVSYLPMPVVGGYLAFIGYFCLEAGVALCISEPMTTFMDWKYLFVGENVLLALPGLASGLLFTLISRKVSNDAALPVAMTMVPVMFYVIVFLCGAGLEGARESGWLGEKAPSVPISDLFQLIDFSLVQWSLVGEIIFTWVGMVLVVSFASCLDVAAISMDMGEALDTNKELTTVGICNFMSGLGLGFTGSYIFSQTIFTYRTGVHSRWIGIIVMAAYIYIVASPVNILEVVPLFFLGSTLIFIGYDLLYEWLIEVRHKIFLSEYAIVWATFVAIHVVGMDAGIVIGILVSLVDHVVVSASTSGVNRVIKQSRAVWSPEEHRLLQNQGYNRDRPKIITLEIVGTVFFGSSLQLFQRLVEEVGVDGNYEVEEHFSVRSPHSSSIRLMDQRTIMSSKPTVQRSPPKFVVLDLSQLSNLDASASRGCFLQFAKVCAKRGITVCASGASRRAVWMLRSHDCAYEIEEENKIKGLFQAKLPGTPADHKHHFPQNAPHSERILMFLTTYEALEFCENALLQQMHSRDTVRFSNMTPLQAANRVLSLATVFEKIIGASSSEVEILKRLDGKRYYEQVVFSAGEDVFTMNVHADAFYVVLKGTVAVAVDSAGRHIYRRKQEFASGAGVVSTSTGASSSAFLDPLVTGHNIRVASLWSVGGIFGYVDFLLQRPRVFRVVASQEETVCAKLTHSHLNLLKSEDPLLDALLQRVLLQVSILDLANCTCDE